MGLLRDVIGQPYFMFDNEKYDDRRLSNMLLCDLKVLSERIEKTLFKTEKDLYAKRRITTSIRGDSWYQSKQRFLSLLKKVNPLIKSLISLKESGGQEVGNEKANERSVNDYFVDEARNYLGKEVFDTIMRNAVREKQILLGIK